MADTAKTPQMGQEQANSFVQSGVRPQAGSGRAAGSRAAETKAQQAGSEAAKDPQMGSTLPKIFTDWAAI